MDDRAYKALLALKSYHDDRLGLISNSLSLAGVVNGLILDAATQLNLAYEDIDLSEYKNKTKRKKKKDDN